MNIDKFMNRAAGTVLIALPLTWYLHSKLAPYNLPKVAPQHVIAASDEKFTTPEVSINGENISIPNGNWSLQLLQPRSYFRGVEKIGLLGTGESAQVHMHLCQFDLPTIKYLNVFYQGQKYIYEDTILLKDFRCKQGNKRLLIDGTIDIPTIEMKNDDEAVADSITFSLSDLNIQLDTELIYQWSDKPGNTYRL